MRVLALDTATPETVVALLPEELEARHRPGEGERPGHAAQSLVLARELLDRAGVGFGDLERVAVGVGPGTFTGLRIGVATARALAQAAGAELVGVSTLRALAAAAREQAAGRTVLAVLDARRGEAFVAGWRGDEPVVAAAAVAPEDLAAHAAGTLAVGDGALRFRDVLEHAGAVVPARDSPLHRVSALALARLGRDAPAGPSAAVVPEYVRAPDAELALRRRTGR